MEKIDIISDCYSQLRISGLTKKPTPEDLELALSRLEDMAAEWSMRMSTGYNFEDSPQPSSKTNLPRQFKQAYATNLAVRLSPDFGTGIEIAPALLAKASGSLRNLSAFLAMKRQTDYPARQPIGSGNQRYGRWSRFYWPVDNAPLSPATINISVDEVNDYTEHFDAYLDDAETIASYVITADSGLLIESDSNSDVDVYYRLKAVTGGFNVVSIEVTTSSGRVEKRETNFNVG